MKIINKLLSLHSVFVFVLIFLASPAVFSQSGKIVSEKIHSQALEKTATGESPDRDVAVYLPPDYDVSPAKRYPVIYLLHGIGDTHGNVDGRRGRLEQHQERDGQEHR